MDWKWKAGLGAVGAIVLFLLAYWLIAFGIPMALHFAVAALYWLLSLPARFPANFGVLGLTICVFIIWRIRLMPDWMLNPWSFVCLCMLCATLAFGAHDFGSWVFNFFGETTASILGWIAGIPLAGVLFWSGIQDPPIEPLNGSVAMFAGYLLGLELRRGKYGWPFGIYRDGAGHTVPMVRKPTREIETLATTPNKVKMRAFLSLETWVTSVQKYLSATEHDEILLNAADEYTKTAIEGDDTGKTAGATSNNRGDIRSLVEYALREDEGNKIGIGLKVVLRQLLGPESLMEAAAQPEIAANHAAAQDIAAARLTARNRAFMAANTFDGPKDSMDRLLAADGKADLEIKRFEGFDAFVKVLEDGITKAIDAFKP